MKKSNILIVEDEHIAGMDIKEMIEESGYGVVDICDTGRAALDEIKRSAVDLVLMDIYLPGDRDGIETTQEINKEYDMPVVYLTAYSDDETLERARATNPSGFLIKPVTEADLKATFEMALEPRAESA